MLRLALKVLLLAITAQAVCVAVVDWLVADRFNALNILGNATLLGTISAAIGVFFSSVLPERYRLRAACGISVSLAVILWSIGYLAER